MSSHICPLLLGTSHRNTYVLRRATAALIFAADRSSQSVTARTTVLSPPWPRSPADRLEVRKFYEIAIFLRWSCCDTVLTGLVTRFPKMYPLGVGVARSLFVALVLECAHSQTGVKFQDSVYQPRSGQHQPRPVQQVRISSF